MLDPNAPRRYNAIKSDLDEFLIDLVEKHDLSYQRPDDKRILDSIGEAIERAEMSASQGRAIREGR